jgi:hypothetical protein
MEATCSSEKSFDFELTSRRHIPEDRTRRNNNCQNAKSYKFIEVSEELIPAIFKVE